MTVKVTKLEGLSRKLDVVVPAQRFQEAYQERLKEVAKNVRVPGFRSGKIPFDVIEKKFGKIVMSDVASELMQSGFQQAVTDNQLKVAGSPQVTPGKIAKDQDLQFEVAFETLPEIQLADFKQAKVEKYTAQVTEEDLDKMVKKLQRQHAHWHAVSRAAALEDRVKIDFDGFIEGKPFPGGNGNDFVLELGSRQMIPGFEEGLIGANANEDRSIDVVFPQDYPAVHLAGKNATFKIKIKEVQEAHLPELDQAFFDKLGIRNGTIEELKKNLRSDMNKELNNRLAARLKDQVLDALIALNPIEIPQSMVEDEIKQLQEIAKQQISAQPGWKGKDAKKIQLPRDPFVNQAKKRVVLGLLIGEQVKRLGIKSDKNKVREKINEMVAASGYHNPEEMVAWYYQNKRLLSEIETLVLEDQVVDKLLEEAQVSEKHVSYQEAFANQPQQT
ncbi:MAG: trigger factor [Proteobacteria bacterium]|nr:trigger factor [Pseudomonadota bacterium]